MLPSNYWNPSNYWKFFSHCKKLYNATASVATLLTYFAPVDLAAGAWPEAFEMPGKAN